MYPTISGYQKFTRMVKPASIQANRLLLLTLLAASGFLHACKPVDSVGQAQASTAQNPNDKTEKKSASAEQRRVVATVDDQSIFEDELMPLIQSGVDRAIALDRAINRLVTAKAARQKHEKEAQQAVDNASRDILSQLYIQKATQRLSDGVKDEDIRTWYDRKITPDDYREFRATYLLVGSSEDAARLATEAMQGEKKALAKFKSITDQTDQWLKARDFPYGLGQVVSKMKPGEISKPIALRNGWFVLMLKESREQPVPTLDSVKSEIRNILVAEALVQDINQIRQGARIELK